MKRNLDELIDDSNIFSLSELVHNGMEFVFALNDSVMFFRDNQIFVYNKIDTNQYVYKLSYEVRNK